jgi:hypothetical protein
MNIRPLSWRDLLLLNRYRRRGLFLDSSRVLIHGQALLHLGTFFTYWGPLTRIFTYRCDVNTGVPLIGQITYTTGSPYARLSYLAPDSALETVDLSALSDFMAMQVGREGAFHILADVDETSPVFPLLRRSGFAIYARQRIWRSDGKANSGEALAAWKPCKSGDVVNVHSLYCNVVPGLIQQVESLPKRDLRGFVHYQKSELRAFVELKYGRNGIWVQPFVHPDAQDFDRHLTQLLQQLPGRHGRPLYICVRSYQSWLEAAIEATGAQPGPQQAVMIRHLSVNLRVKQALPVHAINGTRTEPTAPIAQFEDSRALEYSETEKNPPTGNSLGNI